MGDTMESLRCALARLERAGFREAFGARREGFLEVSSGRVHPPESLIVDEIVRFEGESDPDDEAVLLALRTPDDAVRGTFVAAYGPGTDPISAELLRRLDTRHGAGRRQPESEGRTP